MLLARHILVDEEGAGVLLVHALGALHRESAAVGAGEGGIGGPRTRVMWGRGSLTPPHPLEPMCPGLSRPVAGWELFILG